ncbi:MAG: enoyl-ACP reductase [Acidiferrobacterales bacterium]|nr:enoyl-ACP reductase [Acidiferrobacterales bacterium]
MGFLTDKRALITGIASNRSIAWGIAQAMSSQGAKLALTYQNEKLRPRVEKFAQQLNADFVAPCDVTTDSEIDTLRDSVENKWPDVDIVVHSIAFAPREQLEGVYLDAVTREGFNQAHDISSYSFSALAKSFAPMMQNRKGSLLTLTYLGSIRSMPGYNVMGLAKASLEANVRYCAQSLGSQGIRVNAISAGPIRTLAASGIRGMKSMMDYYEKMCPLGRGVTIEEVGNAAAFLCSDLASGITGEILYVDGGFNSVGFSQTML